MHHEDLLVDDVAKRQQTEGFTKEVVHGFNILADDLLFEAVA